MLQSLNCLVDAVEVIPESDEEEMEIRVEEGGSFRKRKHSFVSKQAQMFRKTDKTEGTVWQYIHASKIWA